MPGFIQKVAGKIRSQYTRQTVSVWRAAAALLGIAALPAAVMAQGEVVNRATAVFTAAGAQGSAEAEASVFVRQTAAVRIVPPQNVTVQPGQVQVFAHQVTNLGSARGEFRLSVTLPAGWSYNLYLDLDGDGMPGPGDNLVAGTLSLDRGASAALLLVINVPTTASDAAQVPVTVTVTSTSDASVSDAVQDTITINRPHAALGILKNVSSSTASPGDTLTYTISYNNNGEGSAVRGAFADVLPSGLQMLPGTLRLGAISLTEAVDTDAGSVERMSDGRDRVYVKIGEILPNTSGTVTFKAIVGNIEGALVNVATLEYGDSSAVESNAARTTVIIPRLRITKELAGAADIFEGDVAVYRISWSNASLAPVRNAFITDTIPAPLVFVSAEGNPTVSGNIVTWKLGDLTASQSGSVTVTTRAATAWDGTIVNRAFIRASNADWAVSAAPAVHVARLADMRLEIAKRAGVLEASLGDAIPYIVTVRNAGVTALGDIVISDRLPEGVEFITDRLTGADSARATGRDVRVWIAGPLAAGEERTIRYVVSLIAPGSATSLANMVTAEAESGRVHSDTASAIVQVKRGFALQSRTLLGKVWLDLDDSGKQGAEEPGIPGVEVWSEDGEVAVTDEDGRFSFRNLRLGTHVFRLDTLGLPKHTHIATMQDVIKRVRMDGWTTPRADFRIVPSLGRGQLASTDAVPMSRPDIDLSRKVAIDTTSIVRASVSPLRSTADREAEAASVFLRGPVVRFFTPLDGAVITSNKLFVGVQGEAGSTVRLYNDSVLVGEAPLRPDGKWDFIGVEIAPGTSHLRVMMRNSFNNEMWDSVSIHRAGVITQFAPAGETEALRAESQDVQVVSVRVLDSWGVPVPGATVTAAIDGATITADDEDRSSVGIQLKTNSDGIVRVPVRAGQRVGYTGLELSTGKRSGRVQVKILPSIRSFIAAGTGEIGIGAAPKSFASVTMKGAIGKESSVSVSYDSRRNTSDDDFFGRGYDPLDEGRYPAIGDASERRVLSSSTQKLSAKIEHGLDWVELGDVQTTDFSGEGRLSTYTRSLTGAGAKVTTGALTWRAFGSMTDQVLSQVQARGNGSSGPYVFGRGIRPGTDKVAVEVRSAENASIVIAREELQRFRDYQIDYSTGEILLQRPLGSTDASGNPLFLVAVLELKSGGASHMVAGGRVDLDAASLLGAKSADSLRFYVLGVRDGGDNVEGTRRNNLVGGGLRMKKGLFHAGGEMLQVASFDSSAQAVRVAAGLALPDDRAGVEAEWTRIGAGFVPGIDPRLSSASEDLRITGTLRLSDDARLRITDSRQKFDAFGVERHSTMIGTSTSISGRDFTTEGSIASDRMGLDPTRTESSFLNGKAKLTVSDKASVWIEGSHTLAVSENAAATSRPDQVAAGITYSLINGIQLESSQRWVGIGNDSVSYSVTSVNLRTESLFGGQVWAGVDRGASSSSITSATMGWKPRVAMAGGWSVTGLFERRFGLERAPLADPIRALPFPQIERDRMSIGLGAQWLPKDSVARMSLNGEMRKDPVARGRKIGFEAEAPMSEVAAFLARSDWWGESRETGSETVTTRQDRSILGLALRPTSSNAFNVLAKVEWRRSINPGMGTRFSGNGNDQRFIAATDAIWGLRPGMEIAGRYAVRMTMSNDPLLANITPVRSMSHYAGGRIEQVIAGPLSARLDARVLRAGTGMHRWNAAPSALVTLGGRFDIEGGYRFGNLRDADFAAEGGRGLFATLGVRVTEGSMKSVAGFWRERISTGR